jgi:hypothetical protein
MNVTLNFLLPFEFTRRESLLYFMQVSIDHRLVLNNHRLVFVFFCFFLIYFLNSY